MPYWKKSRQFLRTHYFAMTCSRKCAEEYKIEMRLWLFKILLYWLFLLLKLSLHIMLYILIIWLKVSIKAETALYLLLHLIHNLTILWGSDNLHSQISNSKHLHLLWERLKTVALSTSWSHNRCTCCFWCVKWSVRLRLLML